MQTHTCKPAQLPPGFFWYFEEGAKPVVVEKRDNEDEVRFTNGRQQPWIRDGEKFVGPLAVPH